jgi:hypothetical protein
MRKKGAAGGEKDGGGAGDAAAPRSRRRRGWPRWRRRSKLKILGLWVGGSPAPEKEAAGEGENRGIAGGKTVGGGGGSSRWQRRQQLTVAEAGMRKKKIRWEVGRGPRGLACRSPRS